MCQRLKDAHLPYVSLQYDLNKSCATKLHIRLHKVKVKEVLEAFMNIEH